MLLFHHTEEAITCTKLSISQVLEFLPILPSPFCRGADLRICTILTLPAKPSLQQRKHCTAPLKHKSPEHDNWTAFFLRLLVFQHLLISRAFYLQSAGRNNCNSLWASDINRTWPWISQKPLKTHGNLERHHPRVLCVCVNLNTQFAIKHIGSSARHTPYRTLSSRRLAYLAFRFFLPTTQGNAGILKQKDLKIRSTKSQKWFGKMIWKYF